MACIATTSAQTTRPLIGNIAAASFILRGALCVTSVLLCSPSRDQNLGIFSPNSGAFALADDIALLNIQGE